jgi:hypothetical protein
MYYPERPNCAQATSNNAKQARAIKLGFAWFYSPEPGLFKALRRFQMKNFSPYGDPPSPPVAAPRKLAFISAGPANIGTILFFARLWPKNFREAGRI